MSLVSLKEVKLGPHPQVVAELEHLVERAKAGEIRGFAFIASCDRGCQATSYEEGDGSLADLILSCLYLQKRLMEKYEGEDE